jgi:hypothetical protein
MQRLALLLVCAVTVSFAQEFRASILGQVTDPTGAVIPGVKVRATKIDTNVSREAETTNEGFYNLPGLDPGRYNVTFTKDGFQTVRRNEIVLQVADRLQMSINLEIGSITQEVTVVGEQELIQTATASRGLVFDPVKMQEIPLNGRQAYMLMRLSPGVMFAQRTFGATGFSGTRGWDVNGSFVMNGGRSGSNQFLLNGAPISSNGTFNLSPNVEAVQEMKVMVNTYDVQLGVRRRACEHDAAIGHERLARIDVQLLAQPGFGCEHAAEQCVGRGPRLPQSASVRRYRGLRASQG